MKKRAFVNALYWQASPLDSQRHLLGWLRPLKPLRKGEFTVTLFILGTLFGGIFGVAFMCLFQNNGMEDEDEKEEYSDNYKAR